MVLGIHPAIGRAISAAEGGRLRRSSASGSEVESICSKRCTVARTRAAKIWWRSTSRRRRCSDLSSRVTRSSKTNIRFLICSHSSGSSAAIPSSSSFSSDGLIRFSTATTDCGPPAVDICDRLMSVSGPRQRSITPSISGDTFSMLAMR